jgi:hypothetical protein
LKLAKGWRRYGLNRGSDGQGKDIISAMSMSLEIRNGNWGSWKLGVRLKIECQNGNEEFAIGDWGLGLTIRVDN